MIIRLPEIGRIEAYCIWTRDDRAGFQFERIIRLDDFMRHDRGDPAQSAPAPLALDIDMLHR